MFAKLYLAGPDLLGQVSGFATKCNLNISGVLKYHLLNYWKLIFIYRLVNTCFQSVFGTKKLFFLVVIWNQKG